jgi:hypothetical protein
VSALKIDGSVGREGARRLSAQCVHHQSAAWIQRRSRVARRGSAPALKSAPLLSVSGAATGSSQAGGGIAQCGGSAGPSKKLALPYPTRSTINASCSGGQGVDPPLHPNEVVDWVTRATFPAPAAIAIGVGSTKSGVGKATPFPAPAPCCTR